MGKQITPIRTKPAPDPAMYGQVGRSRTLDAGVASTRSYPTCQSNPAPRSGGPDMLDCAIAVAVGAMLL